MLTVTHYSQLAREAPGFRGDAGWPGCAGAWQGLESDSGQSEA